MKYTKHELARFSVVGATGFAVNFLMLALLHQLVGLGLVPAQLISAETAIISNFILHHNWTYSKYGQQRPSLRFLKFNLSSATASLITLLVLVGCVQLLSLHYLVSLAIGGAAAAVWSLTMNKLVIWRLKGESIRAAALPE